MKSLLTSVQYLKLLYHEIASCFSSYSLFETFEIEWHQKFSCTRQNSKNHHHFSYNLSYKLSRYSMFE